MENHNQNEKGIDLFVKTTPINYFKNFGFSTLCALAFSYLAYLKGKPTEFLLIYFIALFIVSFRIGEFLITQKIVAPIIFGGVISGRFAQFAFILLLFIFALLIRIIFIE